MCVALVVRQIRRFRRDFSFAPGFTRALRTQQHHRVGLDRRRCYRWRPASRAILSRACPGRRPLCLRSCCIRSPDCVYCGVGLLDLHLKVGRVLPSRLPKVSYLSPLFPWIAQKPGASALLTLVLVWLLTLVNWYGIKASGWVQSVCHGA